MLSGPQRKFCEGIVAGLNATDSYAKAYPKATRRAARAHGARLVAKGSIKSEIARLRAAAQEKAGSAVLTLAEKRSFLARLLRINVAEIDVSKDGDLLAGLDRTEGSEKTEGLVKLRLADKLKAIELDNDLSGEGSEAGANDELAGLLARLRK
jgi:phage terminase small subunit